MKTALTIAGSDSSGGAGIQADIKTMTANGVFAMSAVTALTAQNTTGVTGIMEVSPEFLKQQLDCVFTDIRPDAVKIGMVSSPGLIEAIADKLEEYHAENIVVDPVMVATSGARLISEDAVETLKKRLLPMADVLTPNIPETEVLSGMQVRTPEDMERAAARIGEACRCAVLVKGGHQHNDANDLLYRDGDLKWFYGKRIDNPNTHGTGCTLSSAIASNLAKGFRLEEAVERAKEYRQAFLDTGGTEEEWAAHNIQIKVWYEVKAHTDRYLSVAVMGSENWTSAYSETRYYNFDLEKGRQVTLEDLLGEDYAAIADASILSQIPEKEAQSGLDYWEEDFTGVTEDTKFYINEAGNPVIVFGEYEIAPGAAGQPEFEITG